MWGVTLRKDTVTNYRGCIFFEVIVAGIAKIVKKHRVIVKIAKNKTHVRSKDE
ncbi:hypothetical protein P4278_32365 [Bacillus thuringiensis]|nr:hypothetical protein [Bacillus thuringiensis]MED2771496.1 hypothetical protein [Bacillus thuringiensis]MED2777628.1 hypothetical protein [Bacillus thuringiensis]MED2784289.1 hypothetical protein [Bacillus thuringiensis]